MWIQLLRYGERTARGNAEGEATLKERRRAKSNKRIIVSRNTVGEVALFRQQATSTSGEEDDKEDGMSTCGVKQGVAGLRASRP